MFGSRIITTLTGLRRGATTLVRPTPSRFEGRGKNAAIAVVFRSPLSTGHSSNSEVEKKIAYLNREIQQLYGDHQFETAIGRAEELKETAQEHYGQSHPVYASALNNLGLLNKSLGNYDKAIELYSNSVIHYQDSVGKEHPSTATAIHNVGLTFKDMAAQHTGLVKLDLLEKAKDVLQECLDLRKEVLDTGHQDVATTMSALALVKNSLKEEDEAVEMITEAVLVLKAQEAQGGRKNVAKAVTTGTMVNNLGYLLKQQGKFAESKVAYEEALERRRELYHEDHPNVLITMQNLSELERAMGNEDAAVALQQEILDILGAEDGKGGAEN